MTDNPNTGPKDVVTKLILDAEALRKDAAGYRDAITNHAKSIAKLADHADKAEATAAEYEDAAMRLKLGQDIGNAINAAMGAS